ncbi:204_t:CDS:1, partial [Gigaspora margarita]
NNPSIIFQHIQKTYKEIYQREEFDLNAANLLTSNLKQVSSSQNILLTKQITEEEVLEVIQ